MRQNAPASALNPKTSNVALPHPAVVAPRKRTGIRRGLWHDRAWLPQEE